MKKIISVLLIFCLITACVVPSVFAKEITTAFTNYPTIYVLGQGQVLLDKDGNKIYPFDFDNDVIVECLKECLPYYPKAVIFNTWDEFLDKMYEIGMKLFSVTSLDENGECTNGSYVDFSWKKEELSAEKVNGGYPIDRFCFKYDWRLDPFENAKILHDYVEDVLEVTGAEKVEMIGRCLGASVVETYLYLYDGQYVDSYLQYASGSQGVMIVSSCFSGSIGVYPDAAELFFLDNKKITLESPLYEVVSSLVAILNRTGLLDIVCSMFNKTYNDIYMDIIPRFVGDTFGTMPGYWSMVDDEHYEKAKEVLLFSRGYTEDSELVKKIDNYHYNIQQNVGTILDDLSKKTGLVVSNITKYGFCSMPFFDQYNRLNDETATVTNASYGATTSTVRGILPLPYLIKSVMNEKTSYISPDLKIDASTCLYPDRTYFIKNIFHNVFPKNVDPYMARILNDNDSDIYKYEDFPQFIVYDDNTLSPMTYSNMFTDKHLYTTLPTSFIKLVINTVKLIGSSVK